MNQDLNKEIRAMDRGELNKRLQELLKEKFNFEKNLRHGAVRYGYGMFSGSNALSATKWGGGNMKKIKKIIAFIKTILKESKNEN